MSVRRLVLDGAASGQTIRLSPADAHYLGRVLRLPAGAPLQVSDGRGLCFDAVYLGRVEGAVEIGRPVAPTGLAAAGLRALVVALAVLKGPRMDWAVEKLTELGVEGMLPILARRSVAAVRAERWERIARAAARQCGRSGLLRLAPPVTIEELAAAPAGVRLLLEPGAPVLGTEAWVDRGSGDILLAVGPEGGFEPEESRVLVAAGFQAVGLPAPTLRAETAALAGAAGVRLIQALGRPGGTA